MIAFLYTFYGGGTYIIHLIFPYFMAACPKQLLWPIEMNVLEPQLARCINVNARWGLFEKGG